MRPAPASPEETAVAPRAKRCHINLWSLPSLIPGRRLFYFDVGLELEAGAEPLAAVELLLPFYVEEGPWKGRLGVTTAQDLRDEIATTQSAELVFGGPVAIHTDGGGTSLTIADYPDPIRLHHIDTRQVRRVEGTDERRDSSHYLVPFAAPIPARESRYVRMRWRVLGSGPLWSWKRVQGGALLDFRAYDVRESRYLDAEKPLRDRMIPLDEVNVFLISPVKYQAATTSPQWKYLRMLETDAWRPYLGGAAYSWLKAPMLVYYWRQQSKAKGTSSSAATPHNPGADGHPTGEASQSVLSGTPIDPDHPFRVFADFSAPAARSTWREIARLALAAAVLALIVKLTSGGYNVAHLPWKTILALVGVTGVLSFMSLFERVQRNVAGSFRKPRMWLRRAERWIIGRR